MGFFSGRLTCLRFRSTGAAPRQFGPDHLDLLKRNRHGQQRLALSDGSVQGWTAGDHILDTRFDLAKNIVNDTLHFALRIDVQKIPADLLRAYTQVELEALAADNPSGMPSLKQKREARENARAQLERESQDGRFLKRKANPVLWDALSNEVLLGATSANVVERFLPLFEQTFGQGLEFLGAGRQAYLQAEARSQTRGVDDATVSAYVPGAAGEGVAWLPDETNRDFLGNEFLLWLWYLLDSETDTIELMDKSTVTVMVARSLVLECPRGQTGRETIQSEGPTRLPEAHRAIQAGKLPRKAGLILSRHDQQYELALSAESLAISGAKLPAPEGETDQARREERVSQLRHFLETLDLLYDAFGQHRFGSGWNKQLGKIQGWLADGGRARRATVR